MKRYNVRIRTFDSDGAYEEEFKPLEKFIEDNIEGVISNGSGKLETLEEKVDRLTLTVRQLLITQFQSKQLTKAQLLEIIGVYPDDSEQYKIIKRI